MTNEAMATEPTAPQIEQSLKTQGQRHVNLMWERTQATIAISVAITTLMVCAYLITTGKPAEGAFLLLSNVFFLVVGTYFQRTNHTKSSTAGDETGEHR